MLFVRSILCYTIKLNLRILCAAYAPCISQSLNELSNSYQ